MRITGRQSSWHIQKAPGPNDAEEGVELEMRADVVKRQEADEEWGPEVPALAVCCRLYLCTVVIDMWSYDQSKQQLLTRIRPELLICRQERAECKQAQEALQRLQYSAVPTNPGLRRKEVVPKQIMLSVYSTACHLTTTVSTRDCLIHFFYLNLAAVQCSLLFTACFSPHNIQGYISLHIGTLTQLAHTYSLCQCYSCLPSQGTVIDGAAIWAALPCAISAVADGIVRSF